MTDSIQKLIDLLKEVFTWWFFVQPWEKAIRVRAGKRLTLCEAGMHFRVPLQMSDRWGAFNLSTTSKLGDKS
jgi:hypothetical protein